MPRPLPRRTALVAAVAVPLIALALLGLTHPHALNAGDALWWRNLHVVALFLFPAMGVAPWLVLRPVAPRTAVVAAVLGYLFAACYTALDVLAGIGAGTLELAGRRGQGDLYRAADAIALPGVLAYLVAGVLAGVLLAIRDPVRGVPGAVLVTVGAVSFLTSHIYPPRGVATMVVLAAGWSLLAAAAYRQRR